MKLSLWKCVCFLPFFKSLRQCLACVLSRVQFFATPWTVAHQAPLSMGSSRQEYWSGFPCPSLGDRPHPGTEPMSLASPALAGGLYPLEPPVCSKCENTKLWLGWEGVIDFIEWATHTGFAFYLWKLGVPIWLMGHQGCILWFQLSPDCKATV